MKLFCLGAVLAITLFPAHSATKVTLVTDWYPQAEHGGFYQALVKGYYKDEGLDVEIQPGGAAVNGPQRVAVGRADFCLSTDADVMISRGHGLPLVAVGATMQYDIIGLMLHADSSVKSFEDLEGKTISAATGAAWFQYLLKKYNLKDVKQRPLTFSIANFVNDPAYIQQCFITSEPFFVRKNGIEPRVLMAKDAGYLAYRVYFTTDDFIKKNPETVRAFVKASTKGWNDYLQSPEAADKEILRRNPEMTQDFLNYSRGELIKYKIITGDPTKGESTGNLNPARLKITCEQLKSINLLKPEMDETKAYSTEFLPK